MKVDIECPNCHCIHWAIIDIFDPQIKQTNVQGTMFCPQTETYFTIQGQITMVEHSGPSKKAIVSQDQISK